MPSRARRTPPIATASMADMAFLLLLFFLTATTIDVDTGMRMTLPPPPTGHPPEIADRNMLRILANGERAVMIEGQVRRIEEVRAAVVRHVTNDGRAPNFSASPERAIVSFKAARSVPYATYLAVLDAIKLGYRDLHDAEARTVFGAADYATYRQRLRSGQVDRVAARYPVRISLAEPPERTQ